MHCPVLELSALSKSFPGAHGPRLAVDGVSLQLQAGEFVSLMGRCGCGKSTLLNLVAGLLRPSEGAVLIDERACRPPGPDRMLLSRHDALLPWRSVLGNMLFAIATARRAEDDRLLFERERPAQQRARALRYLELFGLAHVASKRPGELDPGVRQRIAFARALALEPRILLLDEPLAGLDALGREQLQDDLLAIWARARTTTLMVTHDLDEALLLSDRVVLMTHGPAAQVEQAFEVVIPRPRTRQSVVENPTFYTLRNRILKSMYGDAAT